MFNFFWLKNYRRQCNIGIICALCGYDKGYYIANTTTTTTNITIITAKCPKCKAEIKLWLWGLEKEQNFIGALDKWLT